MPITWRDDMATGAPTLDADHQQLFRIVNTIELAMSARRWDLAAQAMDLLLRYVDEHFPKEEAIMEAVGFPDLDRHKRAHIDLTAKSRYLTQRFKAAKTPEDRTAIAETIQTFLDDWLLNHVIKEDVKIKPLVPKKAPEPVAPPAPAAEKPKKAAAPAQAAKPEPKPAAKPIVDQLTAGAEALAATSKAARMEKWGMVNADGQAPKYDAKKDLQYDVPPQFEHLMRRLEYTVPELPPPQDGFEDFQKLCEAAICRRMEKVLVFFQRFNPDINRPLPQPCLTSAEFATRLYSAATELAMPPIWESRPIRMLSTKFEWQHCDTDTFWGHIDDITAKIFLESWKVGWEGLKLVETKRDGQRVLQVKEQTKRLREWLQPPKQDDYDLPKVGNLEIDLFRSLFDPTEDHYGQLVNEWRKLHDLYEQEMDPRVFQQKARDGAFRDGLINALDRFPSEWSDFLVLTCHRTFPRVSVIFLTDFIRNFGRNETEHEANLPYIVRYLRQARAHPTFMNEDRQIEDDYQAQLEELKRFMKGEAPSEK